MNIVNFYNGVLKEFIASMSKDSQAMGSYENGLKKEEDDRALVGRFIKARKDSAKVKALVDKYKLVMSNEGVYSQIIEERVGKLLNKHSITDKVLEAKAESKKDTADSETILSDIKILLRKYFIETIKTEFSSDSVMQKTISIGETRGETQSDIISRICKARKSSARTQKIADRFCVIVSSSTFEYKYINFDATMSYMTFDVPEIDALVSMYKSSLEDVVNEEETNFEEVVTEATTKVEPKAEVNHLGNKLVAMLKDIEAKFINDSIVQKYIFDARKSDNQTDRFLLTKICKFRSSSRKIKDLLEEYNMILNENNVLVWSDHSPIEDSTEFVGRVSEASPVVQAVPKVKSMAELNAEKSIGTNNSTFKETKSVDELKKEVYGNILPDMLDRDALTHISTQLVEIFKNDTVVKKSFLVADKNQEGLAGKFFRAQKIRPSSAGLKALASSLLCDIDSLDDFKNMDISSVISENENDKKFDDLKNSKFKYQIAAGSITIYNPSGEIHNASRTHPEFDNIKAALEKEEFKLALTLISKIAQVREQLEKMNATDVVIDGKKVSLSIENRVLKIKDESTGEVKSLNGTLGSFIVSLSLSSAEGIEGGQSYKYQSVSKFILKMAAANMNETSMDGLFLFLRKARIPINEEGNILTYKRIRGNWKDCHSGTIDNSIGAVVTMPREKVTFDPNVTCAAGLHVCSYGYLSSFSGERIVICEVEPQDVVSVPKDYNFAKMRCCRYKVVEEVDNNTGDVLSRREKSVYLQQDQDL